MSGRMSCVSGGACAVLGGDHHQGPGLEPCGTLIIVCNHDLKTESSIMGDSIVKHMRGYELSQRVENGSFC